MLFYCKKTLLSWSQWLLHSMPRRFSSGIKEAKALGQAQTLGLCTEETRDGIITLPACRHLWTTAREEADQSPSGYRSPFQNIIISSLITKWKIEPDSPIGQDKAASKASYWLPLSSFLA